MIDQRFSAKAFDTLGLDTLAARSLADQLAEEIQRELDTHLQQKLTEIVSRLNGMGHDLRPYDAPAPGDISYRDDVDDEAGYRCRLRVGVDTVVSTGFAHLTDPDDEEQIDKQPIPA